MTLRRGLIGLFSFIFLISGISLGTLVVDDRHDLSSRASILPSKLQTTTDEVLLLTNESVWDGSIANLPFSFKYNPSLWIPPQSSETVFIHRNNLVTVRVGTPQTLPESSIKSLLGADFTLKKKLGVVTVNLPQWVVSGFVYDFFGDEKYVYLWKHSSDLSLLSVSNSSDLLDINTFASGVIFEATKIKGVSTLDGSAKLATLIRPSVVMVITSYCAEAQLNTIPGTQLSDKKYPFCLAAGGSGFFVNSDGYIATNGHVVKISGNDSLVSAVVSGLLDDLLVDYTQDYLRQIGTEITRDQVVQRVQESKTKKESLLQIAGALLKLKDTNLLSLKSEKYQYFIQTGSTPIAISKQGVNTGQDILEASLVDIDYKEADPVKGFSSSDVALLKVNGKNFPSLSLGKIDDLAIGSELQIFGFPGVVSGKDSLLLDSSSTAEPTVTRGVVSAIKKAKGDQRKLVQTDATINHGSSGGPAVDSQGNVLGIATYGLVPEEGGGNYNFLRDISDLKDLMKNNNIASVNGDTYKYWKQGLESFWLSYYKYSLSDLSKVKDLYPTHPTVDKYLAEINEVVNTPADLTPLIPRSQRKLLMNISGALMALSLLVSVILLIIDKLPPEKPSTVPVSEVS